MATATKKPSAATPITRSARNGSGLASLKFLVYRDNGGDYHWEIAGGNGAKLAQSGRFPSHDDAERAARRVYDGAGSARFEPNVTTER